MCVPVREEVTGLSFGQCGLMRTNLTMMNGECVVAKAVKCTYQRQLTLSRHVNAPLFLPPVQNTAVDAADTTHHCMWELSTLLVQRCVACWHIVLSL